MIGIDGFGMVLVALALSLMTVDPIHCAIARARARSIPITAMSDLQPDGTPATDSDAGALLVAASPRGETLHTAIERTARIHIQP